MKIFKLLLCCLLSINIISCEYQNKISWQGREVDPFIYIEYGTVKNEIARKPSKSYSTFINKIQNDIIKKSVKKGESYYEFDIDKAQISVKVKNFNNILYFTQDFFYSNDKLMKSIKIINNWRFEASYYYEQENIIVESKFFKPDGLLFLHRINNLTTNIFKDIFNDNHLNNIKEFIKMDAELEKKLEFEWTK